MREPLSVATLVVGITTFMSALICFLIQVRFAIVPGAGGDLDFIGMFLVLASVPLFLVFWPLAATGLVLSIVTLFSERNKWLRLLPLAIILVGIFLFASGYYLFD